MNEYEEILSVIVDKLGKSALTNSSTFKYIDDFAPKSDTLVKNRLKTVFMFCIFSRFSNANDVSGIIARLQNELFYPSDFANMLVSLFAKYLGIDASLALNINNFSSISNAPGSIFKTQNTNSNINIGSDFVYVKTPLRISAKGIYVCIHQVTQQEYFNIMGDNPSYFKGLLQNPVEQVTWFDAIEYCNLRSQSEGLNPCYVKNNDNVDCNFLNNGYRLLTELEWEFVARGGFESKGFKYSGSDNINDVAWYKENSRKTHPVMQKKPNELGIYDMSGNVCEWCWDLSVDSDSTNPHFSYRVIRGGSYGTNVKDRECECGCSRDFITRIASFSIGFRVARSFC